MGKPYSEDLRERAVAAIEAGHTRESVAELFRLSLSTVGRLIRRKRETGSIRPDKFGGYKKHALHAHADRVWQLVSEQPDITLLEIQAGLAKDKVTVSQTAIFRFLRHGNLTFKKKVCTPPNKTGRMSPLRARRCGKNSPHLIRRGWSSLTKPALPPT